MFHIIPNKDLIIKWQTVSFIIFSSALEVYFRESNNFCILPINFIIISEFRFIFKSLKKQVFPYIGTFHLVKSKILSKQYFGPLMICPKYSVFLVQNIFIMQKYHQNSHNPENLSLRISCKDFISLKL